ncbi:unnamed protein product [Trichobilharzia szidati]|nr:unnamed protein product [Trichobilharzia szidati]
MNMRQGKSVFVRSKFRMLKRTQTMHVEYTGPMEESAHLQRHESWQSLELDTPPVSSGTGETDAVAVASTTKAITPGDQTTGSLSSSNQGGQDNEQMDLASRRGRRSAIIDNKNLIGESEVDHQDTPGISQSSNKTLNEVGQERPPIISTVNSFRERQRRMLRKQNTIADLSCRNQVANTNQDYELKRRANVFMKLIERGTRSKESLLDLNEALQSLKSSYFHDQYLESFRDFHWSQLDKSGSTEDHMPDREVRRREAVWELFKSELTFFIDHLMVLKNCFMEPLKKLQVDGYLMFVEPMHLFGNLDDLCYVSHTFCRELIGNLSQETLTNEFGSTDVLLRPLKRWSEHSRDGEIYHNYCLNYDSALTYLDSLRKFEHFNEFEKWCEQDARCRRLQLTDLLVAPMQHYMKIPLMLSSIRRYTASSAEQEMLTACLTKVENSLKSLEDKMRWLKNFERLQEIQSQLIWPSVSELEPRVFIPEFLRQSLARQPCERLIANPKRQLLHEGFLTLNDGTKTIEIFAFLFDDFLLITRIKKPPKKKSFSENPLIGRSITEGGVFVVYRQVIALDRFTIHDLGIVEATANGLRNAIVLVLITRFQQITGVYTLQAANELDKQRWIEKLRNSQQAFQEKLKHKLYGIDIDQHTNKHSKLINQKPKLTNQVSLAEDTLSTSLACDVKRSDESSGKLNNDASCTTNQDKKTNDRSPGNLMSNASTRGTSKSPVNDSQLSTVQQQKEQQKQESELQECDSLIKITSHADNPVIETIHECNSEPVRSDVIVEISEKDNAEEYLKVDNPSPGNTDCSSDELGATVSTPISLSEVLLPNSKTPEYLIRNRHSLDPNLTKLTIPEISDINPPTETSSSSSPSTTTATTTRTDKDSKTSALAQTNTEAEKQIVAPIFSPPSLLLFDRVSHPTNFAYAATRQTQFSPPLSPILHAPCASLPLDITTQNLYDLPDRLLTRLNVTGNPISSDSESHEERLSQKTTQNPPFR